MDQLGVVLRLDSSLNRDYTGWFSVLRAVTVSVKCAFPAPHIYRTGTPRPPPVPVSTALHASHYLMGTYDMATAIMK